jgi:hypothetical protein
MSVANLACMLYSVLVPQSALLPHMANLFIETPIDFEPQVHFANCFNIWDFREESLKTSLISNIFLQLLKIDF